MPSGSTRTTACCCRRCGTFNDDGRLESRRTSACRTPLAVRHFSNRSASAMAGSPLRAHAERRSLSTSSESCSRVAAQTDANGNARENSPRQGFQNSIARGALQSFRRMAASGPPIGGRNGVLVSSLPPVIVYWAPAKYLLTASLVHDGYHRNCGDQAADDPSGDSGHVSGWLPHGEGLILYSVVLIGDQWICLTQQLVLNRTGLHFIPDIHLEWRDINGVHFGKNEVPQALHRDRGRKIRIRDEFKALVALGYTVFDASNIVERGAFERASLDPK